MGLENLSTQWKVASSSEEGREENEEADVMEYFTEKQPCTVGWGGRGPSLFYFILSVLFECIAMNMYDLAILKAQ